MLIRPLVNRKQALLEWNARIGANQTEKCWFANRVLRRNKKAGTAEHPRCAIASVYISNRLSQRRLDYPLFSRQKNTHGFAIPRERSPFARRQPKMHRTTAKYQG